MQIHIDFDKIEFNGQFIYKPYGMSCIEWERFWESAGNPYTESEVAKLEKTADDLQSEVESLAEECKTLEREKDDLVSECDRLQRIVDDQANEIVRLQEIEFMYESVSK